MKNKLTRYRSIIVIAGFLVFNLVSSLLVQSPDGVTFTKAPTTVTEWICDIISTVGFFLGFLILMYDSNKDSKEKMKEAFEYGAEKLREINVEFEAEEK